MSKWQYTTNCSRCGRDLTELINGKRCKGMCVSCYDKTRHETLPSYFKENKRVDSPRLYWDSEKYLGLSPSPYDWARLAAYIDGEGSINLSPRKVPRMKSITFCGRVVIVNTDFRLASWCADTFGMVLFIKRHSKNQDLQAKERNWKDCYYAQACGYRAAWILRNCLSWFLLKREQAEVVLSHQETTKVGTWERKSGVATPQDLLDYRMSLKDRLTDLNRRGPENTKSTDSCITVN
jgi:hypothetical protein